MPVPAGNYGGGGQPSCFDRMKMGFIMGCTVGMCSGMKSHAGYCDITSCRSNLRWIRSPENGHERRRTSPECWQSDGAGRGYVRNIHVDRNSH